jgi:hypothetical protein
MAFCFFRGVFVMKPVHDRAGTEPVEVAGPERSLTPGPVQPDEEQMPSDVETSADVERATEEHGYGYGV